MATAQYRSGQALGWMPLAGSPVTAQINGTAIWFAQSFVADAARTLDTVRVFVSAKSGALASGDITCSLYDSTGTSGVPGSSVESGKLPSSTITAAGWYSFTGFTAALTAGQMYWLVFKNGNASPAVNFPTFRVGFGLGNLSGQFLTGFSSTLRSNWGTATTSDSGINWSHTDSQTALRVGYSDGSFDGIPVSNIVQAAVGDGVYSTRESGVVFTSPANASLKVRGIGIINGGPPIGSPTGNIRFGLWTGSTPSNQGYTVSSPNSASSIVGYGPIYLYFASTITIQPSTIVRVTYAETTNSDTSSNRYNNYEFVWDSDSNSLALLPWNGTCKKTYFNGSTWTDTAGSVFGHALLLDTGGEFAAAGGGANLLGNGTLVAA